MVDVGETQDRGLVVIGTSVVVMKHYSLGRLGQVFFFDSLVNVVFEQQVDLHVSGSSVIEYRLLVSVLVLVNVMIQ